MMTKEQKDFSRRMADYDYKIESSKRAIISLSHSPRKEEFVVCRFPSYMPVKLTTYGTLAIGHEFASTLSFKSASLLAIECNSRNKSSNHAVVRLIKSIEMHVKFIESMKQEELKTHGALNAARNLREK